MDKNEYENLIQQGYTEEEIDVSLDDVSRMSVFDDPLGDGREDRGVTVRDSSGLEKRTSSIMMGYNKQGITLENGEYVSWEEVEMTLDETLGVDEGEVTYVCKKTGKVVEPSFIVEDIFKRSIEKTHLSHQPTDKITNQQAAQMIVHDEKKGAFPKGISMLGNDGLELPSGDYVSREEVELAIQDYVRLTEPVIAVGPPNGPVIPPVGPTLPLSEVSQEEKEPQKNEPEKEEVYDVIKRIAHKISWLPAVVTTIALIISGFGHEDEIEKQKRIQQETNLTYNVEQVEVMDEIPPSTRGYEEMQKDIVVGEDIRIDDGISYYASSDHKYGGAASQGIFGEGVRESGDYNVDGFAILRDGKIIEQEWNVGQDLFSVVEEVSKDTNTPVEELEPMIHLGGPVAGWVDINDLIDAADKDIPISEVKVVLDDTKNYEGVIEDFKGDIVTINNGSEDVELIVRNGDGTFVEDGTFVIGSDGEEYQITDLEVENVEVIDYDEVKTGEKLKWSVKNITLEEALAWGALGVIGTYLSKKIPRKEMAQMTGYEIDELIEEKRDEFKEAKGEYEGVSAFKEATATLTGKQIQPPTSSQDVLRGELIDQNITVEDITNMSENISGGKAKK